jgi:rhodanese-related sulfurtransferase
VVTTPALREISQGSLWRKVERGDALVIVDALSPISFAASHLPGAINIPPQPVHELAERRIPDRNASRRLLREPGL